MQVTNVNINYSEKNSNIASAKKKTYKNIAFCAAPGNFINPNVQTQKTQLIAALRPILENGKNLAAGFEQAIKGAFPIIRLKIGNVSDLMYPSVQKDKPAVFSRTSFKKEKPLTFLYLNFPEIINICKSGSAKRYTDFSESLAETVALANEPHYISDVISYCTDMAARTNNITLDFTKNLIDNCLKVFGIDIDNVVMDKKQVNIESEELRNSTTPVTIVNRDNNNVETKLCLIFDEKEDEKKQALSHEFTHVLNANSLWINDTFKELYSLDSAPIAQLNYGLTFQKIYEAAPNFLKQNVSVRGDVYEKQLKNMFEQVGSDRDKRLVFDQILANVSDEALAYSQTPNLFSEYASRQRINGQAVTPIPIGWFFTDFYDFLLAVKNNPELYESI